MGVGRSHKYASLHVAGKIANVDLHADSWAGNIVEPNSPAVFLVVPDVAEVLSGWNAANVIGVPKPSQFQRIADELTVSRRSVSCKAQA